MFLGVTRDFCMKVKSRLLCMSAQTQVVHSKAPNALVAKTDT
jgi:hypothetical protein